jgi:uncharacterized protein
MIKALDPVQIDNLISKQVIGRLGCHADGEIYVVPIGYVYDGEYIYGHTYEGRKIQMMRKNPEICFEVDDLADLGNWKSVIAWGHFEEITDHDQRKKALQLILEKIHPLVISETILLSPDWPFVTTELERIKGIVYRIRLDKKTGRYEKKNLPDNFAS